MANSEDQRHHSEIPSTARINEPPPTYEEAVSDIPSQYPRLFDAFNEALQNPNEAPKSDDQNDEHLKKKDKDNDIIRPEELSVDRLPSSPPPLYPPNYLESNPSNLTTTSYVHPPSYSEFANETTTIESSNAYRFEHWQSAQFNRPRFDYPSLNPSLPPCHRPRTTCVIMSRSGYSRSMSPTKKATSKKITMLISYFLLVVFALFLFRRFIAWYTQEEDDH